MLGFIQDGLQRSWLDIGPLGPTGSRAGSWCCRGFDRQCQTGTSLCRSPPYSATFAAGGFQVDESTDQAVELMKQIKVYSLAAATSPPLMEFLNGSGHDIDTCPRITSASSSCWQ